MAIASPDKDITDTTDSPPSQPRRSWFRRDLRGIWLLAAWVIALFAVPFMCLTWGYLFGWLTRGIK